MPGEGKAAAVGGFPGGYPVHPVWVEAQELKPIFADQLQVTRIGDVFHLTFGQVLVGLGHKEEPGSTPGIEPVVRVVISREALARMADLLTKVKKDWMDPE
jgi:hypothetical protein